ncbi:sterile alpha motif domain-containing protein 15-like [Pimephales promelas]|uniref:sterile alpha motif domain-containing protein 15-like n=1 Tax=Pimephales promelas TaxID=90988 RepID=UPI0019558F9D|nr:sterile alpha motif domain-containing protein 15-like [Pimephales promelas]
MEFLHWSCQDVALWIESIGFPQYKACFMENFITGRKLVHISCISLPKLGISDFQHMKTISAKVAELLGVSEPRWSRSIADPPHDDLTGFLKMKSRTGQRTDSLTHQQFLINNSR